MTDVQLKFTKDGTFRHFGFIGFQSPEEAERAASYFNETFINQSKISVELCAELGLWIMCKIPSVQVSYIFTVTF